MDNIYIILAAISILIAAVALILTLLFTDRVKETEGENCEYTPGKKDRPCCKKRREIELGAT